MCVCICVTGIENPHDQNLDGPVYLLNLVQSDIKFGLTCEYRELGFDHVMTVKFINT